MGRDLWQRETAGLPLHRRWFFETARAGVIVSRGFVEDQLLLRASALTFSTLMALVPFLALGFAALKGFGVQNQIQPWLLDQVAAGARDTVSKIVEYVDRTDVRALGALGLILLIFTVVSVIANLEKSLNTIWGVKSGRSWLRRFTDYLAIVLIAPIVLFATLTVTAGLEVETRELIEKTADVPVLGWLLETFATHLPSLGAVLPYLLVSTFFVFLYSYLPNTKVKFRSALLAGIFAGVLWQLMQWGYVRFQIGAAKYNAIYGTLAQLPLLLIWFYLSWVVFLLGAEIAFAHQHLRTYAREREGSSYSEADREALALRAMIEIAKNFSSGETPWTAERLCEKLNAPLRLLNDALFQLKEAGLLAAATEGTETRYLLARDPGAILVGEILTTLRRHGEVGYRNRDSYVSAVLDKAHRGEREGLKDLTLREALHNFSKKEG